MEVITERLELMGVYRKAGLTETEIELAMGSKGIPKELPKEVERKIAKYLRAVQAKAKAEATKEEEILKTMEKGILEAADRMTEQVKTELKERKEAKKRGRQRLAAYTKPLIMQMKKLNPPPRRQWQKILPIPPRKRNPQEV